jgi:hypothetical protein
MKRRYGFPLMVATGLACGLLFSCSPPSELRKDGVVMGRVMAGDGAACGVSVAMIGRGGKVVARATTDESGAFTAVLPPGRYQVVAQDASADPGKPKAGERFAHPGRNPINLPAGGDIWVGLQMVSVKAERRSVSRDPSSVSLHGVVIYQGKPVAGAVATLVPEGAGDGGDRGQGFSSAPATGDDGAFAFDFLPPGAYRLSVKKRQGGGREGPVREGDLEGFYPLNPISAQGGEVVNVEIEVTVKKRPYFIDNLDDCPSVGIAGIIRDGTGKPVEGVYVFGYRSHAIGKGKPDSVSAVTGGDGRYLLPLPSGGRFYLGARERFGEAPTAGEWYGLFTGSAMHDLTVPDKGVLQGIDIVVERIVGE